MQGRATLATETTISAAISDGKRTVWMRTALREPRLLLHGEGCGSKQRPSEIPSGHHPLTSCDLTSSTCAYVVVWVGGLGGLGILSF